jgi:hypothetical protein
MMEKTFKNKKQSKILGLFFIFPNALMSLFPFSFFRQLLKHEPLDFQPLFGFGGMRFFHFSNAGSSFCHMGNFK